jgi:hypothetical protein
MLQIILLELGISIQDNEPWRHISWVIVRWRWFVVVKFPVAWVNKAIDSERYVHIHIEGSA